MIDEHSGVFSPDRLRGYREASGHTRKELAAVIGTTVAILKNYEFGMTVPCAATIGRLTHALGLGADSLYTRHADGVSDYVGALMDGVRTLNAREMSVVTCVLRRIGHCGARRRDRVVTA